jgi:hypothetical protein
VLARNAKAPESGVNRIEGRDSKQCRGRRYYLAPQANSRLPGVPDTQMACAFLRALRRWLDARRPNSTQIVLPTGVVSDAELVRVLRAIFGSIEKAP